MAYLMTYNIDLLKEGNKREFERVYFDFFDVLYALGIQYTSDRYMAESIVQDTFLKLWEVRESLLPETNIRNFLYTLTKNSCLNYLRDQKVVWKNLNKIRAYEYTYAIESLKRIGNNFMEFEELSLKLDTAIENLPDELKVVFKMSRFDDMRYRDIAEKLAISEKTVEARMTRALKILRSELKDFLPLLYLFLK
jgi:RNA polymerase sigma-70 factor (ECF subfamily)